MHGLLPPRECCPPVGGLRGGVQRLRLGERSFPTPFLLTAPKETVGKAIPAFRGKVSPCGEFLFVRTKRNQKCAGGQARRNFRHQGRAFVLSACTPGPPFLRGPRIRSASHSVRRAKSGHPLLLSPLPLILAKTAPSAAHGSAPGGAGTWIRRFFMQTRPECLSGSAPPAPGCWPGLGNR